MKRLTLLSLLLLFAVQSYAGEHGSEPSEGARDMAGARGTIEFRPPDIAEGETTWWKDSDGVDPGSAGCHIGVNSEGEPNGRLFGEACVSETLLVESNPGAGRLHSHTGDIGHPDTFDCNAWCVGNGSAAGHCEAAEAAPCPRSARCACD